MSAYSIMMGHRYQHFALFLVIYLLIIVGSVLIITIIFLERSFHQPMYFLICNLSMNGIYGSTGLLPALLHYLLSENHEITLQSCLTQIYCLHTYVINEFTTLAVMGYDRYLAICQPLHYHHIMSVSKTSRLIAFTWSYSTVFFLLYFSLTLRLKFCGKYISKLFCVNFELIKLSCTDTAVNSLVGILSLCFFLVPQLLMILFSYAQILRICLQSKSSQIKALQTCIPHLVSMTNYTIGALFELVQSRANMGQFRPEVRIFLSLYYILIPPLFNPVIYGIGSRTIRIKVYNMLCFKNKLTPS